MLTKKISNFQFPIPYFRFAPFLIGFLYFISRRNFALLPRFTFLFLAFFSWKAPVGRGRNLSCISGPVNRSSSMSWSETGRSSGRGSRGIFFCISASMASRAGRSASVVMRIATPLGRGSASFEPSTTLRPPSAPAHPTVRNRTALSDYIFLKALTVSFLAFRHGVCRTCRWIELDRDERTAAMIKNDLCFNTILH